PFPGLDLRWRAEALSSRSEDLYLRQCVNLGAVDVLVRPLESQVVKTLWLSVLRYRRREFSPGSIRSLQARPAVRESSDPEQAEIYSSAAPAPVPAKLMERISELHSRTAHVTSLFVGGEVASGAAGGRSAARRSLPALGPCPTRLAFAELPPEFLVSEKTRLLRLLRQWDFNPRDLADESEVVRCVALVLEHAAEACGGLEAVGVGRSDLHRFIVAVRSAYYADNPYHNFHHGVDVMQAVYVFLLRMGILEPRAAGAGNEHVERAPLSVPPPMLLPHEAFALLVAALCHDLGHPGVNNAYMVSSKSSLAELYNDSSVLENFHAAGLFALMRREDVRFFPNAAGRGEAPASELYNDFRRIVTTSILATDMARHAEYVAKLDQHRSKFRFPKCRATAPQDVLNSDEKALLAGVLMKCADISNPCRPFPVAVSWSTALLEEFQVQSRVYDHVRKPGTARAQTGEASPPAVGDAQGPTIDDRLCSEEDLIASVVSADNDVGRPSEVSLPGAGPAPVSEQAAGQIAFIDNFCRPLFECAVGRDSGASPASGEDLVGLAELEFCLRTLEENREEWVRRLGEGVAQGDRSESVDGGRAVPPGGGIARVSDGIARTAAGAAGACRDASGDRPLSEDSRSAHAEGRSAGMRTSPARDGGEPSAPSVITSGIQSFGRDPSPPPRAAAGDHPAAPEFSAAARRRHHPHPHHHHLLLLLPPKGNRVCPSFDHDACKPAPAHDRSHKRRVSLPQLPPFRAGAAAGAAAGLGDISEEEREWTPRSGGGGGGLRRPAAEEDLPHQQRKHGAGLWAYLRKVCGRPPPPPPPPPHQDQDRHRRPHLLLLPTSARCVDGALERTAGRHVARFGANNRGTPEAAAAALQRRRKSVPADWKVAHREIVAV
ncbi:MAG: hypothetical protein BJ554DRAFT_8295, partial [Olpidium bornovanus]